MAIARTVSTIWACHCANGVIRVILCAAEIDRFLSRVSQQVRTDKKILEMNNVFYLISRGLVFARLKLMIP
jgi:hypothetical protein